MTTARVARVGGTRRRVRLSASHAVALAAGVLAAVLNFMLLTAGGDAARVAVLTADVGAGSVIESSHFAFRSVELPEQQLAALFGEASDSPVGLVAAVDLEAGALLPAAALRPPAAPSALRAFSIAVPPERAVAGAIGPGDRVDVLVADQGVTTWLASDLEVLAVAGDAGGIGAGGFSVTVAADADAIAVIAGALESGDVSLVRATGATPLEIDRGGPDA